MRACNETYANYMELSPPQFQFVTDILRIVAVLENHRVMEQVTSPPRCRPGPLHRPAAQYHAADLVATDALTASPASPRRAVFMPLQAMAKLAASFKIVKCTVRLDEPTHDVLCVIEFEDVLCEVQLSFTPVRGFT